MIRILKKRVADKIAAGEVIDRPVSIIKELLENALDAGASAITVEIRNGGKSYIRVTDNGCGIPAEEAELAFQRHATSKITSEEDLNAIGTLGFRGEALASICAVARVELITKTADAKSGRRLLAEGSTILENAPMGCPDGTTVTVRDLFYNVPARNKFLASDSAETRRIVDMVSRIALSYGDVKFNLINGTNKVFSTRGTGNILNNIISIYGSAIGRDLLPVERAGNGFLLKGFVSSPAASAPSRSRQIFCVNGRVISSNVLEKALDKAFKEKLFHGRFPVAFLFLAMPPEKLDVNVHPTKKEIRFDDPFEVSDFVTDAVRETLAGKNALPQVRAAGIKTQREVPKPEQGEQSSFMPAPEKIVMREEVDVRNILSTLRREEDSRNAINQHGPESGMEDGNWVEQRFSSHHQAAVLQQPPLSIEKPVSVPLDFDELTIMGAIFNTYIAAFDKDSFYLMDQHAAHERVFYEKLLEQYNREEKLRQPLILPLSVNVSAQAVATEESWIQQVGSIGYDITFFGNNTYLVREIPAFMELEEAESFLMDLFRELEDKPDLTNQKTLERIIMRSCKSAVKGGDVLSHQEIEELMKDLRNCINPFSCPHGRPTFIRMGKYEIEKMFKRV